LEAFFPTVDCIPTSCFSGYIKYNILPKSAKLQLH
jgi:hypothetical protein